MTKKGYLIILLLFLLLTAGYYIKESRGFIIEKPNSSMRSLLVVAKEYPDLFKNDPVMSNVSMIKYIPSQLFLLTRLKSWAGDLAGARRILLVILVFFTSWTTFFLYYKATSNPTISALAVVASIVGVIIGLDEWFGFMGIDATIGRYNFGVFTPLLLLFYLKNFHSIKRLSLLFLFLGLGTYLHPPSAIVFAIVCVLTFIIVQKFELSYLKWIFVWLLFFIIGSLPFILYFGDSILSPGLPVSRMGPSEFYGSGLYLYTVTWLKTPLKLLVRYFYFVPYITMGSMTIIYFLISGRNNTSTRSNDSKKEDKILLVMGIISFSLIIFSLTFLAGVIPRIIGPHRFDLHRAERLMILIMELFVVKLCVSLWKSKYSRILRVALIACILIALASGFSGLRPLYYGWIKLNITWPQAAVLSKYMQIGSAIFLSLCMLLLIMRQKLRRYFIIPLLFLITAPHVLRSTDGLKSTCNLILNKTTAKDLSHSYFWERIELGPQIKDVALWARDNTKPGSVFMLNHQQVNMQFKYIARRPTAPSKYEIWYVPLRERPAFSKKIEEIEKVFKSRNPEKIIELAKKHKVDYVIILQRPKYDFGRKHVYKNRYYEVFSVSEK